MRSQLYVCIWMMPLILAITACGDLLDSIHPTHEQADSPCEIHLNAQSVHDTILIFPQPRNDLAASMGGLAISLHCDGECPPLSVAAHAVLTTPDNICEADRLTCGIWYQVPWTRHNETEPTTGWVYGQDEDINLIGDCENLPVIPVANR